MSAHNVALAPLADTSFVYFSRIEYGTVDYDPDPSLWPETEGPQRLEDEHQRSYRRRRCEWEMATRRVVMPEVEGKFDPEGATQPEPFSLKEVYGDTGRPLQVIVKLANIELSPEKPEYGDGTGHVEGKLNEHIVATALYYYSSTNITSSSLAFRQASEAEGARYDISYPQHEFDFLREVFGCDNEEPAVQFVAPSPAIQTKKGHRKIVALFLVDPDIRVISTANVPCQQMDWWREEALNQTEANMGLGNLPLGLQDQVFHGVDGFPISLDEGRR